MALLNARRATDRDGGPLEQLCAEATKNTPLWRARRERLQPGAWFVARAPVVVVSDGAATIGFAAALSDTGALGSQKHTEVLVYVSPTHRRRGAARAALSELISTARTMGLWKMVAYALSDDGAPRALLERIDFREVGQLVKHAQVDGAWRDVVLYERLVMAARKSLPSIPER